MNASLVLDGLLGYGLVIGGYSPGSSTPLVINQELHCVLIATSSAPSPWSIDPERTQELNDLTSPSVTPWSDSYTSTLIKTSPSPSPWSIDPERTQQLT
jgi:hypothetical protein